ncbi:MAG: hypothetical protein VB934_01610, partial [Polyangiaceae bacterium]
MIDLEQLATFLEKAVAVVAEPLGYVFDPSRRVHVVFLASSLLLAVGLYVAKGGTTRGLGRYLFHPKLWWSRSARLDYKLLFANGVIRKVLFAPLIGATLGGSMAWAATLHVVWGAPQDMGWSKVGVAAAYTVT